jgi:levansucrase
LQSGDLSHHGRALHLQLFSHAKGRLLNRDHVLVSVIHSIDPEMHMQVRPTATAWQSAHLAKIDATNLPCPPVFTAEDIVHLDPAMTLWDIWPIQLDNGDLAEIKAGSLWVMLSAPRNPDPDVRHDQARMRLLLKVGETWTDCGNLLPDGFSPGSREWSGSTRLDPATGDVTLWFTAAGRRSETKTDFEQRLFHARGKLDTSGATPVVTHWCDLTQTVVNTGKFYADLAITQGNLGQIKGFRDPYWFRDPKDGTGYILFTASRAPQHSKSNFDGVIGIAKAQDDDGLAPFDLIAPIVDAYGLASELERPHMFVRDGLYYVFWSTQGHIFDSTGSIGPTGLYGMVGPSVFGPFEPLNGSSLVLSNPPQESRQAYAWQVVPNLEIVSFVDYWGLAGREPKEDAQVKQAQFGGSIAPSTRVRLAGNTTQLIKG